MTITVIGAGSMGAAIAQDLHECPEVSLVQVCDARARSLQRLHDRLSSPRIRSFQIDARDLFVLRNIIEGSAVVIGAVPGNHNHALAALCVELGIHYCDLGGPTEVIDDLFALGSEARAHGVWIVPNCGIAPGLVNALCLHAVDQFDAVETVQLRVGDIPVDPTPPFNFCVSWSPEKIIEDYTNPAQAIVDGALVVHEPLTGVEAIHFAPPYDTLEAFWTQGGLSTLARDLTGRVGQFDHKTIRWPGHAAQMHFLLALGFGERQTIDVRTHLSYRDVLVRRMRQRLGEEQHDVLLLRVLVRGTTNGATRTLVYEMIEQYDDAHRISAMRRCTAIPTTVLALMLGRGEVSGGGAATPEHVVPRDAYIEAIRARGLTLMQRWYDEDISISDAVVGQTAASA